jgi:putative Mg2+ transporter-C (MgtC) family protein
VIPQPCDDVGVTWDLLGRMLLAVLVGAVIGAERESRDKDAGFRTMTLICLGSAVFTIVSIRIGEPGNQQARIAAQIVTGVGFLGAGAIMRDGPKVSGLTTAAAIWLTASLGMAIGGGDGEIAVVAGLLALLVLLWFVPFEAMIDRQREIETYAITCSVDDVARLRALADASGLRWIRRSVGRVGGEAKVSWTLIGHHDRHATLADQLLRDENVTTLVISR